MNLNGVITSIRDSIEFAISGIEALAVAILVAAIIFATCRYLLRLVTRSSRAYENYKVQLGKALLLSLELLVAADVVRTVTSQPTLENVGVLGLLVLVRTFLSLSTIVEIEGRWPWSSPGND